MGNRDLHMPRNFSIYVLHLYVVKSTKIDYLSIRPRSMFEKHGIMKGYPRTQATPNKQRRVARTS